MAAFLPYALAAIPGLLSGAASIYSMAKQGKGIKRRRKVHKRIVHRGRGPLADVLSNIPLLGMIAGPLARSMGAGMIHRKYPSRISGGKMRKHRKYRISRKRGYGLQINNYTRHWLSAYSPYGVHGGALRRKRNVKKTYRTTATHRKGYGLLGPIGYKHPSYSIPIGYRPKIAGLLAPAGGKVVKVRGHFKHVNGKRVHVPAHTMRVGGYIPYRF